MEKPPYVPTNAELNEELEKLKSQVQRLTYDVSCLKAEQEHLKRKLHHSGAG